MIHGKAEMSAHNDALLNLYVYGVNLYDRHKFISAPLKWCRIFIVIKTDA